ncbi:MAG: hypothetical protein GY737_10425 [Desulfobacteraceae bacterium]|nr:hypothetical protein [Desulfobacteraceae bacterium]
MATDKPGINPYLFERQFHAFRMFVEEKAGVPFVSFGSHPYTEEQEGYKYEIHKAARGALAFQTWKRKDIGNGEIIAATIKSIEIPQSNLVPWQGRFGKEARPQQPLYEAQNDPERRKFVENCLFRLYHESTEVESFDELISIFGRTYPLLAYFYFIKDRSKYLPIAPTFFDRAFELLGADFKTSRCCSRENYANYIGLIGELKDMLAHELSTEVTLLDAHSFAWMLSAQMESEKKLADVEEYLSLSSTEQEAIVKARIGQGQFRKSLINYWSVCAVTGCSEPGLLRASHIKPWSKSTVTERLSLYNGLLLSPALDLCFDSGYVSFDDTGNIMLSEKLSEGDLTALGIHRNMKLAKIEPDHKKHMAYHRENIFK